MKRLIAELNDFLAANAEEFAQIKKSHQRDYIIRKLSPEDVYKRQALDYLKSKERNIDIGRQDSTRSLQPNITITLADNAVYPYKGYVDFAEPQVDPQTGTLDVYKRQGQCLKPCAGSCISAYG